MPFSPLHDQSQSARIKVIGVGGAGGNAVDNMVRSEIEGVEFICVNTDRQNLDRNLCDKKLPIGENTTKGLGAGARPEVGEKAALESQSDLRGCIAETDMLFIAAGMGGGTGTGAAPEIAKLAKEQDILTIAVVTKPFDFEGKLKAQYAQEGLDKLRQSVDSLICVPNQKLLSYLPRTTTIEEAYAEADSILRNAVKGIAEMITVSGLQNVDFNDVCTVMKGRGMAMMGLGRASGENRATEAARKAISSPLLDQGDIKNAEGILVNVMTSRDNLGLFDLQEVSDTVREMAGEDAVFVAGCCYDDTLGDDLVVTVVVAGWSDEPTPQKAAPTAAPKHSNVPRDNNGNLDYNALSTPPGLRSVTNGDSQYSSVRASGLESETVNLAAFLRRQAD